MLAGTVWPEDRRRSYRSDGGARVRTPSTGSCARDEGDGRNTYGRCRQIAAMDKQQVIAIIFVLLMIGSSIVAGAVSLF